MTIEDVKFHGKPLMTGSDNVFAKVEMFQSVRLECKLLKGLVDCGDINHAQVVENIRTVIAGKVTGEYFSNEFRRWLFTTIIEHYNKYGTALTVDLLHQRIGTRCVPNRQDRTEYINDAMSLFKKILDRQYIQEEVLPMVDDLRNRWKLRSLFSLICDLLGDLKTIKAGETDASAEPLVIKYYDRLGGLR